MYDEPKLLQGVYAPKVLAYACGCIKANGESAAQRVFVRRCIKHAPTQRSLSGKLRSLGNIVDGRTERMVQQ